MTADTDEEAGPLRTPAGLLPERFEPARLEHEVRYALDIADQLRAVSPDLPGWLNFPLLNRSGEAEDLSVDDYAGTPKVTSYGDRMPYTLSVAQAMTRLGFDLSHARVALLFPRRALRPHVDMRESIRLIVTLNHHQGFRHVFSNCAVAMRTGELWAIDGSLCHGAVNLTHDLVRVALLLDARNAPRSETWRETWEIPEARHIRRPPWLPESRDALRRNLRDSTPSVGFERAEEEWQLSVSGFDLDPQSGYHELILALHEMATQTGSPKTAQSLRERAAYWADHNCVCVPVTRPGDSSPPPAEDGPA